METLQQFDLRLFYFVNHELANPLFDSACRALRHKSFLIFCYLVFAFLVYRNFPGHFFKIALAGAVTFLLTDQISASLIKPVFARMRPCNDPSVEARLIIQHCGSGFSFVSAHATNSFGMAAFLCAIFSRRFAYFYFGLWAALVSFSQVYVGVHYPGDIIAGGILGTGIGAATGIILKTKFNLHSSNN